ncbi:MAG: flagellar hook-length control protein FliK [Campylobacter sp.]|nr:flagellar hook-length control protein FliK [Campylobacter sp.]
MINQLASQQVAANTPKTDLKTDSNNLKDSKEKLNSKDALTSALKQNLGLNKNASTEEVLQKLTQNQVGEKLQELVNKLLDQINANKNPNSPILKQGNNLNFAPNFSNELKTLSTELGKSDIFTEVLNKLEQILKPASEIKADNFAPLLKNSGVFFEAKLKDALNEELLPKSFHKLLNTIKSLSSENISSQIANLASMNLSPEETLKGLALIINQNRNENKEILKNSDFKALLELGSKIENFKNYINKNPSLAQNKILKIAEKITKELDSLKDNFFKALSKPENLMIKDPNTLRQVAQSFEKLENTLKNILEGKSTASQNKTQTLERKDLLTKIPQHDEKTGKTAEFKESQNTQNSPKNNEALKEDKISQNPKEAPKENSNLKENETSKTSTSKNDETPNTTPKDTQNSPKNNEALKEDKISQGKNLDKTTDNEALKDFKNSNEIKENLAKGFEKNEELPKTFQNSPNYSNTLKDFIKQNSLKNLAFDTENGTLEDLENLSKDLSNLSRKINESLKQLDPNSQSAKINLNELKNLENKLNLSAKDLQNITTKTEQDIASEIRHDVKSTLLQISNLAKNEGNEAVYNQANRLLAQIEVNQLMSLANDSINTYLPFFWDDLNDSKVMFRRGKKDKFFAQIKLEFAKLGNLEILISLNNEKYIDINIMAENQNFRKTIYENAHELKRSINKAGLLSANFFVGDIIRSKLDVRNIKNYDLEMGMDKKV